MHPDARAYLSRDLCVVIMIASPLVSYWGRPARPNTCQRPAQNHMGACEGLENDCCWLMLLLLLPMLLLSLSCEVTDKQMQEQQPTESQTCIGLGNANPTTTSYQSYS